MLISSGNLPITSSFSELEIHPDAMLDGCGCGWISNSVPFVKPKVATMPGLRDHFQLHAQFSPTATTIHPEPARPVLNQQGAPLFSDLWSSKSSRLRGRHIQQRLATRASTTATTMANMLTVCRFLNIPDYSCI